VQAATPARIDSVRQSLALQHFFDSMRDCQGMEILDLGEFSQPTREYFSSLGHRLYHEDMVSAIDRVFGSTDPATSHRHPELAHQFLSQTLSYDPGQFDAILVWDTLHFTARPLLETVAARLLSLLRSRGSMLACFNADPRAERVQSYSFRITGPGTLELHPRSLRKPAQTFTNRGIEKLFERFAAVKFYLTRDSLREVLVRK
jgi:hypothetical protein